MNENSIDCALLFRGYHPSMSSLRPILIVEDSAADAEMSIDALREARLANPIVHVEDGLDALAYLFAEEGFEGRPSGDPAVVLLDIEMPRLNGVETLRRIRAEPRFKTLPVVILTSSREDQVLVETWNLGVNAFVVKPVDEQQFLQAVKTIGKFWAVLNEPPE